MAATSWMPMDKHNSITAPTGLMQPCRLQPDRITTTQQITLHKGEYFCQDFPRSSYPAQPGKRRPVSISTISIPIRISTPIHCLEKMQPLEARSAKAIAASSVIPSTISLRMISTSSQVITLNLLAGQEFYKLTTGDLSGSRQKLALPDLYELCGRFAAERLQWNFRRICQARFLLTGTIQLPGKYFATASVRRDGSSRFSRLPLGHFLERRRQLEIV